MTFRAPPCMYQCCGYHFNYYTLLFVFYFCNVKIILCVIIYCIYVANIISLPTTTQGCFFFWKCTRLSQHRLLVKGMVACWMTRGLNSGRNSVLYHSSDSQSPTHPPTQWVLDPAVQCLEVE